MHRTIRSTGLTVLIATAALAALIVPAEGLAPSSSSRPDLSAEEEPLVSMEILADVSHVTPGAHFQLAVQLEIAEHWHVYWKNQGDTGLPTLVTVEGPEGYTIGETLYPGPRGFESAGGIRSYGYEESVCLLVPVSAPLSAQVGSTASFQIQCSWLVCKEACFRQSAESQLDLTVATRVEDQVPRPTNTQLFKHWRARLPRPQAELAGTTLAWWNIDSQAPVLELRVRGCDELEFFPAREETLPLASSQSLKAPEDLPADEEDPGPGQRLTFDARTYSEEQLAPAVRGVVRVRRGKQERFYRFAALRPTR